MQYVVNRWCKYYSFDFEANMVENWFSSSTKREEINHSSAVLLFHKGVVKNFNPKVLSSVVLFWTYYIINFMGAIWLSLCKLIGAVAPLAPIQVTTLTVIALFLLPAVQGRTLWNVSRQTGRSFFCGHRNLIVLFS